MKQKLVEATPNPRVLAVVALVLVLLAGAAAGGHGTNEPNDSYTEATTIKGDVNTNTEIGDADLVGQHSSKDADGDGDQDAEDDLDWFRFYVNTEDISSDVTVSITNDVSEDGDLNLRVYSSVSSADNSDNDGFPKTATLVDKSETNTDDESITISKSSLNDDTYYYILVYAAPDPTSTCSGGQTNDGDCDGTFTLGLSGIPDNYSPTAPDDSSQSTDEDTQHSVGDGDSADLLELASDPDDASLSLSKVDGSTFSDGSQVTLGSGATVTVNSDGSWTYDPSGQYDNLDSGDTTTDSFTYTVEDGSGATDQGTITVDISGKDDPVDAPDDSSQNTDEDTQLSVSNGDSADLLELASDPDDEDTPSLSKIDGSTFTSGSQVTLGSGATVTVDSDGSWTYDPNGQYELLVDGESNTDTFTYTVDNGNGGTDQGTITVTIDGVTDTEQFDFSGIFNADVVYGSDGAGDFDGGDRALVSETVADNDPDGDNGNDGLPDDGVFSSTSTHPKIDLADFHTSSGDNAWQASGTETVTADVTDGKYSNVHVIASAGGADPNTPAKFQVTFIYADGSEQTSSELTVPDWFGPADETVDDPGYFLKNGMDRITDVGGSDTYDDANDAAIFGFVTPVDSARKLDKIEIEVTNNPTSVQFNFFGATATQASSDAISKSPAFTQESGGTISVSVDEDQTLDLASALEVRDGSYSDTLDYTVTSQPTDGTLSGIDGESLAYTGGTLHTLSTPPEYDPDTNFNGGDSFKVKVEDSDGNTATATVDVTVNSVNDSPTFSSSEKLAAIDEDVPPSSNAGNKIDTNELFKDEFTDVDGTYTGTANNFDGIVVTDDASTASEGTWQYKPTGGSWTDVGSVSDSAGLLLSKDARLRFDPAADYNGDPGKLTVHAVDDSGSTTFTSGSSRETYDTTADGKSSVAATSGNTLGITVNAVNDPPVADAGPDKEVTEGSTTTFDASGTTDPDAGETLSYEWDVGADGSVEATGETPQYTFEELGTYTVELTVTDGSDATDTDTITVEVIEKTGPDETPPDADAYVPDTVKEGSKLKVNADNTTDNRNLPFQLDYEWDFDGDGETDATGQSASHVYEAGGEYTVTLTATDASGNSATDTATVTVIGVPEAPVADAGDDGADAGAVAFTAGDELRTATDEGITDEFSRKAKALAPMTTDFDGDGAVEIPHVVKTKQDAGDLQLIDASGETSVLVEQGKNFDGTDVAQSKTIMAVGSWKGSPTSVFYVDKPKQTIYRVAPGSDPVEVASPDGGAEAALGVSDLDDDGDRELVYLDRSETVRYLEDDGSLETTGVTVGSDNGLGAGAPADFDGDGVPRVPIVTDGNLALVDAGGTTTTLTEDGPAANAGVAGSDVDHDGDLELVFVGPKPDETLLYVDDVGGDNAVRTLAADSDDGGSTAGIAGDHDVGVVASETGAAADRTIQVDEDVEFDGSDSTDDGTVEDYEWDFDGDGSVEATGETVTHDFSEPGTYTLGLTVTDDEGLTDRDTITVQVEAKPTDPAPGLANYHGGLANTGHYPDQTGPATEPEVAWEQSVSGPIAMQPTIVNDTVYVGVHRGKLHAFDRTTGEQRWTFSAKRHWGFTWSTPTVVDGTLYVGSTDRRLYALDAATGEQLWNVTRRTEVRTAPAVADGRVYIGSNDGSLSAYDVNTGERLWIHRLGPRGLIKSNPAVSDGVVYFGSHDGTLRALDADTGEKRWEYDAGYEIESDPTVAADTVFVGTGGLNSRRDGAVVAVNAETGEKRWSYDMNGPVPGGQAYADGTLYAASRGGDLVALNADDGRVLWEYSGQEFTGAPIVAGGVVYVADFANASVHAFDAETGEQRWRFASPRSYLYGTPLVRDGLLYYGSNRKFFALGPSNSPPTAAAGTNITAAEEARIEFDGSNSTDDDGIASYEWTFGDGATATGPTPTYAYGIDGEYTAELTVTDTAGQTASDTVGVTVIDTSVLVADAGANRSVDEDVRVGFDAANSESNEGIDAYEWAFGDSSTATGESVTHTYGQPGIYEATLMLTDSEGNTATDTVTVTVADTTPPTVDAGGNRTVEAGTNLTFSPVQATDNDGITSYTWRFADGSLGASGETVTHAFAEHGTYNVTLTATDAGGNAATDSLFVTVESPGPGGTLLVDDGATEFVESRDPTVVEPNLTISNATSDTYGGAKVSINDGFESTDRLGFDSDLADSLGVSGSYDETKGVLTFDGEATPDEYQQLLRTVTYESTAEKPSETDRDVTFSIGRDAHYFPETGHYYEFVDADAITWPDARDAASDRTHQGLQGYLATVTSDGENDFIATKVDGDGWFGASDSGEESVWRWVTGPEGQEDGGQGRHFFTQTGSNSGDRYGGATPGGGNAVGDNYENWAHQEPNDWGAGEDYAHYWSSAGEGEWNDYRVDNGNIDGYVVEYGGLGGQATLVDTKTLTVTRDDPPTAEAGSDLTAAENTEVQFDNASTSDDFGIDSHEWDFDGDGTVDATAEAPTHVYEESRKFTATLTVTDTAGQTATDSLGVTVEENSILIADGGANRSVDEDTEIKFDAGDSKSNEGIDSYDWDVDGDGTTDATGESAGLTYEDPGTYRATLTLTDEEGNTATDTVTVTVTDTTAPGAAVGDNRTVTVGQTVEFDGSGSADNGAIESYEWSFGDGETATDPQPTHTFEDPGTYKVTLTVTDAAGNTDTADVFVTVQGSDPEGTLHVGEDAAEFVELRDPVVVAPELTIENASSNTYGSATVSIGAGFAPAEDELGYDSNLADSAGVSGSYDAETGVLTFDGEATPAEYQQLLRTVTYRSTAEKPDTAHRNVTFSIGSALPSGSGHFYEYVSADGITWLDARDAARGRTHQGMQGYLATVTSAEENALITEKLRGPGWIGASDAGEEGIWRWATGPEGQEANGEGRHFFTQTASDEGDGYDGATPGGGNPVAGEYHNWDPNTEPNDWGAGEDYAHFCFGISWCPDGAWNDFAFDNGQIEGYVVEYGGLGGSGGSNASLSDTKRVTVARDDRPAPEAGSAITAEEAAEITFDGTGSTDDFGIEAFEWTFGDGASAAGPAPTHVYEQSGEYTATLTVTDTAGQTATDSVSVTVVENSVLIADGGGNVTAPEGTEVEFDASGSDSNEGIDSYEWDFDGDGTVDATGESITHTYGEPGTYQVTLTLTDQEGNTATDTLRATITDETDPAADAGDDRTVDEDTQVRFDAGDSSDNGVIETYEWDFDGDGVPDATGPEPVYSFDDPGTYEVTLTVVDGGGNTDTDTSTVTVADVTPPAADVGSNITTPENAEITFDGSNSTDNLAIDSFEWEFGDGAIADGQTATHVYGQSGEFTATLTVTDAAGNTGTDSVAVTVVENSVLVVDAGPNRTIHEGRSITFHGSGSQSNEGIQSYEWDTDGDGETDATGLTATETFDEPGTYEVRLTLTDEEGNTATDAVTVTVEDATPPTITGYGATNPSESDVQVTFTSSERLGLVDVKLEGPETATLTEDDFAVTENDDGTFDYAATYPDAANGTYDANLTVRDEDGNAATDEDSVEVGTTPPDPDAGSDRTVDEDTQVGFDATDSSDNGQITGYEWDFDGDGETDATSPTPTHTFEEPGTYDVTLTVTDDTGATSTDTVTVTVEDVTPPVADAGPDPTTPENTEVEFDGSDSTDNVGITSYEWDFDGDGTTDATGPTATHLYDQSGEFTTTLTVEDAAGNAGTDTVGVTVEENSILIADAGSDRTVDEDTQVTFDASGSDSNEGINAYEWDLDADGETDATGPTATRTFEEPGTYEVTLTVTDEEGNAATDTITVTVEDATPPEADAGEDRTVEEDTVLELDASGSTDNVGIERYEWDVFGDGTTDATGETPTYLVPTPGTYEVTLTVTDAAGNTATDTVKVTVEDVTPPVADAGTSITTAENAEVTFDGTGSTDNVGITSYEWAFGDGGDATGESATHVYDQSGEFTATLTVRDGAGNSDTDSVGVTVVENSVLIADAGADRTVEVGESVAFDASGSDSNEGIDSFEWDLDGDGETDATGQTATRTFDEPGTYEVTLTLTDEQGNTATDAVTVTVERDPPAIFGFDLRRPSDERLRVGFGADERLDEIRVSIGGAGTATLTEADFAVTERDGVYAYVATVPIESSGTYTATLSRAADADGNDGSAGETDSVTVPSVTATASGFVTSVGAPVNLRAVDATVPPGATPTFEWDVDGDGVTEYTGREVAHAFRTAGTHEVTLTLLAGDLTATDTIELRIEDNVGPTVRLAPVDPVRNGTTVQLNASGSTDDVGIVSYEWSFGDGTTASGADLSEPTHVFPEPGEYAVTVTARDPSGNTGIDSTTVLVRGATARFSTDAVSFGATPVGATNATTVGVTNTGTIPLAVTGLAIDGSDAFAAESASNRGAGTGAGGLPTVRPGETRRLVVSFAPTATGERTGTLTVETNHTDGEVALRGTGVRTNVTASPVPVEFGEVDLGATATETVTLENAGAVAIDVGSVDVVGAGADGFAVESAPSTVPGDGSATTRISFTPARHGPASATLRITATDGRVLATVPVSGVGVGPAIRLGADAVDFGSVGAGNTTSRSLDVRNYGTERLEITDVSVTGPDTEEFAVEAAPDALAPDGSGGIDVSFAPPEKGQYRATLRIESTDPDSPTTVDLRGTGEAADIDVIPRTVNFEGVNVSETGYSEITVRNLNTSETALGVDRTLLTGEDPKPFAVVEGGAPYTLEPGEKRRINLSFSPETPGEKNAQLQIHSDAGNEPQINVWLSSTRAYVVVQEVARGFLGEGDSAINVDGNNLETGDRLSVNVSQPSTRQRPAGFDVLNMTVNRDAFEMNTIHSGDPVGDDAERYDADGQRVVQYVRLNHTTDADRTYEDTEVRYRVQKDALPAVAGPEDVVIHRFDEDDGWETLDAEFTHASGRYYFYRVSTPGFSQFAVTAPTTATRPDFDVEITDADERVTEGEALNATIRVTNVGDGAGTQTIDLLDFDGNRVDAAPLTLDPGESDSLTLRWATEVGDTGTGRLTARSDNDTDRARASIRVESRDTGGGGGGGGGVVGGGGGGGGGTAQPPFFAVDILGTNDPVIEGERLDVTVRVTNTGERTGTKTVSLAGFGGGVVDDELVYLARGESTTLTLTWATGTGDAGNGTLRAASTDDAARTDAVVEAVTATPDADVATPTPGGETTPAGDVESANLLVVEASVNRTEVRPAGTVAVRATVENRGGATGGLPVELRVDGRTVENRTVRVAGGESVRVTFERPFAETGEYHLNVSGVDAGVVSVVAPDGATPGELTDGAGAGEGDDGDGGIPPLAWLLLVIVLAVLLLLAVLVRRRDDDEEEKR